jgi:hypothetical protein
MDGDVESNSKLQSVRCGYATQPTGMLQPTYIDAPERTVVAKSKDRKSVPMQLV